MGTVSGSARRRRVRMVRPCFLPKTWLDVATSVHFYEAVLATLAILVWHFYSVIFDPDVYPLDTAWLTGVSVKEHEQEHE